MAKNNFKNLSKVISMRLFRACIGRNQLEVRQKKDRHGHLYWQAYDPVTERKISLGSEAEMRVWIEQRYYQ